MPTPNPLHSGLGRAGTAATVLTAWRQHGPEAARRALDDQLQRQGAATDRLLQELDLRLQQRPGPRLLLDGVWFSRPYGGITRVWEQILRTWQLPGLINPAAPVCLIERNSHLALCDPFPFVEAPDVNPLDPDAVAASADHNGALVRQWQADVFLSSWTSTSGQEAPACAELTLVHDCLPERFDAPERLRRVRRRWLLGARGHLAVSADTAADLEAALQVPTGRIAWCHSAPAEQFRPPSGRSARQRWARLVQELNLREPFVLLPATSAIGSYKNPELVAQALAYPGLEPLQLLLCGLAAEQRRQELEQRYPQLQGRTLAVGLPDADLALAYAHALAVVIPSHGEGFGLPAIEAMACGAAVLVADSRGLREAGGQAALRFGSRNPGQLAELLQLLLHAPTMAWLRPQLQRRLNQRLATLHSDLIGLALLAMARAVHRG